MPRSYRHISNYEKEILELKAHGLTTRKIGAKLGFTKKQVHNFITHYNEKQRKIKAGVILLKWINYAFNRNITKTIFIKENNSILNKMVIYDFCVFINQNTNSN